jgi:hypothetical protein
MFRRKRIARLADWCICIFIFSGFAYMPSISILIPTIHYFPQSSELSLLVLGPWWPMNLARNKV